ncbi:MAG TPA: DinB family protein [Gemmataceae bacterium]|nr:DinB family protein [Gemmataceae bacterium]
MYPTLQSRDDILRMLDEITEARKQILERCAGLTPAQLNDPVYPGTWSVLQNLAHLAWAEEWMLLWVRKRPGTVTPEERPPEPPPELGAIRTALDEAHAAAIAFLKANPASVLTERCHYSRKGEQTVGGVFFHLIEHEIHHRGFVLHKLSKLAGG